MNLSLGDLAMSVMKTITVILLLATHLIIFSSSTTSESIPETNNMKQQVYTLGVWHVQDEQQQEFITAWKDLGTIFASLPDPPGKGILIQSTSEPTLFYSFGPWNSLEAIEAMRNDQHAQEGIRTLTKLCTKATPGTFKVVAESP